MSGAEFLFLQHSLQKHPEFGLGRCSFSLPSGKYAPFPHPPQPPPKTQPSVTCIFFITSMLMNSWQISDSCFHSFTFADGNILAYLKKKKLEVDTFWKLGMKMLCISFNISCIIIIVCRWKTQDQLKPRAQLGYSETFTIPLMFCIWLEHCCILLSHEALSFLLKWDFEIRY